MGDLTLYAFADSAGYALVSEPFGFAERVAMWDDPRCEMTVRGVRCQRRKPFVVEFAFFGWRCDPETRQLCAEHTAYVDALWGGPVLSDERCKPPTAGIERTGYLVTVTTQGGARDRWCPTPADAGLYVAAVRRLSPAALVTVHRDQDAREVV